jgi:hypothetical protein
LPRVIRTIAAVDPDGIPASFTCPVCRTYETGGLVLYGGPKDYGVSMSRSSALGSDGRLTDPVALTRATETPPTGSGQCTSALGAGGAQRPQETPGTYYWQAWRLCTACALGYEAEVRGYLEVWDAFPRTVRRIVVLRDNPRQSAGAPACVMRARAQRRRPMIACAASRAWALWPDPLAEAARRARSRRVELIDLTHFMCGRARCFPVVGGALVHKDSTHLTHVFARTMGPFLLHRLWVNPGPP